MCVYTYKQTYTVRVRLMVEKQTVAERTKCQLSVQPMTGLRAVAGSRSAYTVVRNNNIVISLLNF